MSGGQTVPALAAEPAMTSGRRIVRARPSLLTTASVAGPRLSTRADVVFCLGASRSTTFLRVIANPADDVRGRDQVAGDHTVGVRIDEERLELVGLADDREQPRGGRPAERGRNSRETDQYQP